MHTGRRSWFLLALACAGCSDRVILDGERRSVEATVIPAASPLVIELAGPELAAFVTIDFAFGPVLDGRFDLDRMNSVSLWMQVGDEEPVTGPVEDLEGTLRLRLDRPRVGLTDVELDLWGVADGVPVEVHTRAFGETCPMCAWAR